MILLAASLLSEVKDILPDSANSLSGWIAAAGAVVVATITAYSNYRIQKLKQSSDVKHSDYKELSVKYNELNGNLKEVKEELLSYKSQFEKVIAIFETITPLLEELCDERPEFRNTINHAIKNISSSKPS